MDDKKLRDKIINLYKYSAKKDPVVILEKLKRKGYKILLSDLKRILDSIPERQLHKRTKETTKAKQVYPFVLDNPRELFQLDLMFMTEDAGYKYILCVIDAFSRYAWCYALKSKTNITKYLEKLFAKEKPIAIGTDSGTEFVNNQMKAFLAKEGVLHKIGMVRNSTSQAIVERFNGTLRRGLMLFDHWSRALKPVVDDYNDTYHSTIKMTPYEAHTSRITEAAENILARADRLIEKTKSKKKFAIGDKVRIILFDKKPLSKGSTRKIWSDATYEVDRIEQRNNGEYVFLTGIDKAFTKNQLLKI